MAAAYPTTPGNMYLPQARIIDPQALPYAYMYPAGYAADPYGNLPQIQDSSQVVTDLDPNSTGYSQPPHHHHHHHNHHQHQHRNPHPHPHHHQHQHHQHQHQHRNHENHSPSQTPSDRSESPDDVDQTAMKLVIRRHSPGALDPVAQELPRSRPEPTILPRSPVVSSPHRPPSNPKVTPRSPVVSSPHRPPFNPKVTPRSILRRPPSPKSQSSSDSVPSPSPFHQQRPKTPPSSRDPDERPIRPMKDASIYRTPPVAAKRPVQKKKPIAPPKPKIQFSPQPPVESPPVSPRLYEPEPKPVSPARPKTNNSTAIPRRPVRLDVIPKRVSPVRSEVQKQPRQVIVEEYDDEEDYDPRIPVRPERVIEYRVISHDSPRVRRVIQTQEMPRRRVIYRP